MLDLDERRLYKTCVDASAMEGVSQDQPQVHESQGSPSATKHVVGRRVVLVLGGDYGSCSAGFG